jgi:hypothetical protein
MDDELLEDMDKLDEGVYKLKFTVIKTPNDVSIMNCPSDYQSVILLEFAFKSALDKFMAENVPKPEPKTKLEIVKD